MNALAQTPELTALVVDDEPQIRRLLTVTLEANGYRVVAVENGREAVIMAAQYRPDIVFSTSACPISMGKSSSSGSANGRARPSLF